jgi:hypothetical protein
VGKELEDERDVIRIQKQLRQVFKLENVLTSISIYYERGRGPTHVKS